MVIPYAQSGGTGPGSDLGFWEPLKHPVRVTRDLQEAQVTFLVEPPNRGFFHACTVEDLCRMLTYVPRQDWEGVETILLRQPTRKQNLLSSAWGRLIMRKPKGGCPRAAICLEACDPETPLFWLRSLRPDDRIELDRLAVDGHRVRTERRGYLKLFRTLLHEIGHWVDFRRRGDGSYYARPWAERESAAHAYARKLREQLEQQSKIPFVGVPDDVAMHTAGIDPGRSRLD